MDNEVANHLYDTIKDQAKTIASQAHTLASQAEAIAHLIRKLGPNIKPIKEENISTNGHDPIQELENDNLPDSKQMEDKLKKMYIYDPSYKKDTNITMPYPERPSGRPSADAIKSELIQNVEDPSRPFPCDRCNYSATQKG